MIEIATLFLGLVSGPRDVELTVAGDVSRVELTIDAVPIEPLDGPPWVFSLDLDDDLGPHELVVVGLDPDGREVDRAVRWINVQQPRRVRMLIDGDGHGTPRVVRFVWETLGDWRPPKIDLSFDGSQLRIEDPGRIPLPTYDPSRHHLLNATVRFADGSIESLSATFGGQLGGTVETDLTAIAVESRRRGGLPSAKRMSGWFRAGGRLLEVHGVENGAAEVVVVRDPTTQELLERLAAHVFESAAPTSIPKRLRGLFDAAALRRNAPATQPSEVAALSGFGVLDPRTTYLFVDPRPAFLPSSGISSATFSEPAMAPDGVRNILQLVQQRPPKVAATRLADAVAVAGMRAHGSNQRRAIMLLANGSVEDRSQHAVKAVRTYLRRLQVPLLILEVGPEPLAPDWGPRVRLAPGDRPAELARSLAAALRDLRRLLAGQRIVWLNGRHLPQSVTLEEVPAGVVLAGS